jgi:soluble lytic murein transglycosylase-like protein
MAPGFPHDQLDRSRAQKIHETFRLYGVLRAAAPRFNHDYAWKLAATVHTESRKHSLDPFLVLAIIRVESAFEEKALSIKGAQGLMQILPFVAEAVAEEAGIRGWNGNRSLDDPFVNIQLGVSYLKTLKTKFKDLSLALAAYRWGPSEVSQRINQQIPVPLEYSNKVLEYYELFGNKGPEIPKVIPQIQEQETT